jgi:uncharacterized protein (DUF488 family)
VRLYTIGHSAHNIEKFIDLLQNYHIQLVVDVRSVPASRFHPQFRKRALQTALAEDRIGYHFAGQQLGGRLADPTCYDPPTPAEKGSKHRRANFTKIMAREWFKQGITELMSMVGKETTAILCSEEDPTCCHRHQLIARYLRIPYPHVEVQHIRGNGMLVGAGTLFARENKQPSEQLRL